MTTARALTTTAPTSLLSAAQAARVELNDPARKGERASPNFLFGANNRLALYAVHSRFGGLSWFVDDAHADEMQVLGQGATPEEALGEYGAEWVAHHSHLALGFVPVDEVRPGDFLVYHGLRVVERVERQSRGIVVRTTSRVMDTPDAFGRLAGERVAVVRNTEAV